MATLQHQHVSLTNHLQEIICEDLLCLVESSTFHLETLPISLPVVKYASTLVHLKYYQVLLEPDLSRMRSFPMPLLQARHETSFTVDRISEEVLHHFLLGHGSDLPFQGKVYSHQGNKFDETFRSPFNRDFL